MVHEEKMKTGISDTRKRMYTQAAIVFIFLLCVIVGNAWSDDVTPVARTHQVSNVTSSSATLKGTVYSNNPSNDTFYAFQWGTTTSYENQTRNQRAGTSADRPEVDVSDEITNLNPNTTYHYRLTVWSSQGQVYGEDRTFTTYVPPTVTTDAATNVTFSSATLIGTVNPNGMKTSVCFYYGPGSDGVNTRRQDVGSGTNPLSVSAGVSTLQPGTTYYYRIEASSFGGTVSGPQMSFTTPALSPIVTTDDATNIANKTATLNGTINPNETNVSYYFQWGPNDNPSAHKTYSKSAGSGSTPVKVSTTVSGLKPGTTYHYTILTDYNYRISGVESRGQTSGGNKTFITLLSPGAATIQATNVTSNSATLNGTIAPNGLPTVWYFEYRKSFSPWQKISTTEEPIIQNRNASVNVIGLDPNSIYGFRIVAQNVGGTAYGPEMSFKTLPFVLPIATTGQAHNITKNSATLEGKINPRGSPVSYWFQYGPTTSYGKVSTGQAGIIGTSNMSVSETIIGLTPNTTYHYRLMTSSIKGPSVYGVDKTFTTPFSPQDVTTGSATNVTWDSATLQGTIHPNGLSITWWFDYGLTPAYGKQTKSYKDADTVNVHSVSLNLSSGLTPNTTYHFRLVALSSAGVIYGRNKTFTTPFAKPTVITGTATKVTPIFKPTATIGTATKVTPASKPTVTTGTATKVTSASTTITGTVNPNGLDTTYYFEYGPTSSYGNTIPTSPESVGNGMSNVNVSADIRDKFTPKSTYHYRIVAKNKSGTAYGEDKVFIIPSLLLPAVKNISPAPVSKSATGVRP
ncbi:MAG TPA: hypothetical protein DDY17_07045 [Syntrophaceae bacterium]|jgi:hypothetical protein|nr:hypothetical protein [Syntrophaceae bacterium]